MGNPDSKETSLQVAATPALFESALKRNFKGGVAEWKIEGKSIPIKSKYDIIKNGALDIEPGAESDELKQLKKDCGYSLEDDSGKKVQVKIKSADRAKAEFELDAPLGVELKTAKKAALIWPLGGLSGDPTLVSDFGGQGTLIGIVAHELGHSNAGLLDTAEITNIMHGVAEGNEGTRGREIPLFVSIR